MGRTLLAVVLVATAVVSARAQKLPAGPPFRVNTFTLGDQGFQYQGCGYSDGRGQATAANPAGDYVVVWQSRAQDGDGWGIFGQRFDGAGTPLGAEFQVNSYTTGDQRYPRVAMDTAGDFVVVWSGESSYYGGYPGTFFNNVRGRRFDASGVAQGPEFEVATQPGPNYYGNYTPRSPAVAMTPTGGFVVVWDAYAVATDRSIYGRRYDSAGTPLGAAFQVSQVASYFPEGADVATHPDGSFVVVWHEDYYGRGVMGRRFGATGTPLAGEFEIQPPDFFERFPRVTSDGGGGFVVAWRSSSIDTYDNYDTTDIALKRYDANGLQIGSRVRVNTDTAGSQRCAAVAAAPDGGFVVTWHSDYQGGFAQQFDPDGTPICAQQSVDPSAVGTTVAMDGSRDFLVAWKGGDGSGNGVFARRFDDAPAAACAPAPKTGCRRQTRDGTGVFRFHQTPDPARSTLNWQWVRGEQTTLSDLGDPVHCVGYALCVYDASGNAQPLLAALAPAADVCGTHPCWQQLSGATQPVEYFDNPLENGGAPTNPDGIRRLRLKPGDDTKARISAQLRGVNLSLPATPLTPPVVVQLQAANGECWTGTYDAFVRKNDDGRFVAKEGSASGAFLD